MNAQQIHDAYQSKLARIENNKTYSDHAKRVMAAKAYKQAQSDLEAQRQAELGQVEAQRAKLQRKMFGNTGATDPNAIAVRRDAVDRAARLDDPRAATDALAAAELSGDDVLAQAIAARAAQFDWTPVIDAYAASRPTFAEAVQEYNDLPGTGDPLFEFRHAGQFMAPTPSVLSSTSDAEISRLAQQEMESA
ncbi:hypothetical protein OG432_30370 [Streptomyces sp. NBC_00442]|uniref:hypothetical protein n=1 Tax=Streptomyces sp. NBC_00442 TaxID=2903651 RepID=UPI002E204B30